MSVMQTLFGAAPLNTNPAMAATPPGNIPVTAAPAMQSVTNNATAPNGTVPAATPTGKDGAPASQADPFADLWQPTTDATTPGQPLFNVSQDKLQEAARQHNFKTTATPEQIAAIAAGGEGAVAAMAELMNSVAQNAYAGSVFATTKLIEGALDKSKFAKESDLATKVRDMQVTSSLRESNPVFKDPAFAPFIETATKQFQLKHPNASAGELRDMALSYVGTMMDRFSAPTKAAEQAKKAKAEDDWSGFLPS